MTASQSAKRINVLAMKLSVSHLKTLSDLFQPNGCIKCLIFSLLRLVSEFPFSWRAHVFAAPSLPHRENVDIQSVTYPRQISPCGIARPHTAAGLDYQLSVCVRHRLPH